MAKTIGRYEILSELGRGGMAAVYLANDPRLNRQVALKLMDQQLSTDPSFAARFEREAKTVAGLEHGAVVSLYDYGEADGWLYLVMRYMAGGTLKEQIAKGPLPVRKIYDVVRRIGGALDKAHSRGIVHRDLKPANILLDGEAEPYLSDFGIVQVAQGDTEYLTQTGQTLGTFAYMSPEQVMGQKLDGRSDLYALGVVLYEMLTGKHPFGEATTSGAMAVAHAQQTIPQVTGDNPAVPAAVNAVVQKALAKDPSDRYATGREMTLALYEALTGKPASATGIASAGVAAASAAKTPPARQPETEKPVTTPPATEKPVEPPAVQKQPEPAPARQPTAAPAQQQVQQQPAPARAAQPPPQAAAPGTGEKKKRKIPAWLFVAAGLVVIVCVVVVAVVGLPIIDLPIGTHGDPAEVFEEPTEVVPVEEEQLVSGSADRTIRLWNAATAEEIGVLHGHTDEIRSVAFSPDGRQLASGGNDETVRLWDATTGEEIAILQGHGGWVWSVAYSPDGRQLASGSDDGIRLWDTATGQEIALLQGHGAAVRSVAYSPDGRQLASGSVDLTVRLWDTATGEEMGVLSGFDGWVMSVAYRPNGELLATAVGDGTIWLWDVRAGEVLDILGQHEDLAMSVTFSPDGRQLASGGWDGAVRLWDMATGEQTAVLRGGAGEINSVAYSPDGQRLAHGLDRTVRVWDVATGQEVAVLNGHDSPVGSVAIRP